MVRKEFTFRGKTMDELLKMDINEFAKLVKSRARRALLRGFDKILMKKIDSALLLKMAGKEPNVIKTHKRNAVVIPKMVGLKFGIYNGKEFKIVEITEKMLGHRFGELAMTRHRLMHGKAGIGATKSSTAITARG